jgi:hypothetical protein
MADSCFRLGVGVGSKFFNSIKEFNPNLQSNKSSIRNVVKNLGMDNNDAVDVFKKNIAPVEYTTGRSNNIQSNVVVKVNNNGVDELYITRKNTNVGSRPPSRWVESEGRLIDNPDYARIDVNQTLRPDGTLKTFVAEQDGSRIIYREATPEDTDVVFLNIQRPVEGEITDLEHIMANNIDAFAITKNGKNYYALVSDNQAIKPIFADAESQIRNVEITDTFDPVRSDMRADAVRTSSNWFRSHGIIGPSAGAIAGSMVDYIADDDESHLMLPAIGAILGSKRNRGRMRNVINKVYPTRRFENAPPEMNSILEEDSMRFKLQEAQSFMGSGVDPRNQVEVNGFLSAYRQIKLAIDAGGDRVWDTILSNSWFESGRGFLRRFQSNPVVSRLIEGLDGMTATRAKFQVIPAMNFDRLTGRGLGAYNEYLTSEGPQLLKSFYPDATDQQAMTLFNDSMTRIMMSGAAVNDAGEVIYRSRSGDIIQNVKRVYDNSPIAAELDARMLGDETFAKFAEANRAYFVEISDEVQSEYLRRIRSLMDESVNLFDSQQKSLIDNMVGSTVSYDSYVRMLPDQEAKILRKLYADSEVFQRIASHHRNIIKMNSFENAYLPQVFSTEKLQVYRDRYYENLRRNNPNMTQDEMTNQFERELVDKMYDTNTDEATRRKLLDWDADGNYQTKEFPAMDRALSEIQNIALTLPDNLRAVVLNRINDFIVPITRPKMRMGKPVTKDGIAVSENRYIVKVPDDLPETILRESNQAGISGEIFLKNGNKGIFEALLNGAFTPRSNWLDMPRTRILPFEFLETDFTSIMNRYTNDAARKIHNMRYDMMDNDELRRNYTTHIMGHINKRFNGNKQMQEQANSAMLRVNNIYNSVNNSMGTTAEEMIRFNKWNKLADTVKNMFYMRLGWAMGFYNMFEHAVVAPLISSYSSTGKAYKMYIEAGGAERLRNQGEVLNAMGIATKHERTVAFNNSEEIIKTGGALDMLTDATKVGAEKVADFSFSKAALSAVKVDVNNLGLARVALDSFHGSNLVSTTINVRSALGEVSELGKIAKQLMDLPADQPKVIRLDGRTYNIGDIRRKLSMFGVHENKLDYFINNIDEYNRAIDQFDIVGAKPDLTTIDRNMLDTFTEVARYATDSFHGTNRLNRPESWTTPFGKAMSMYSTYPFNFSLQHVQRRIRFPIQDFNAKYVMNADGSRRINGSTLSIMYAFRNNDIAALRGMGFSDEAIENFPISSYEHVLKLFGAIGISMAGMMSIDAVRDLVSYPVRDATEEEQWQSMNRWKTLNAFAPKEEQITWGDLDDQIGLKEVSTVMTYMLGHATRTGITGRYGDLFQNRWLLQRQGPLALSPIPSELDKVFRSGMRIISQDVEDVPRYAATEIFNGAINWIPVLGSGIFSSSRKGAVNYIQDEFGYFAIDQSTGAKIGANNIYNMY